MDSKVPQHPNIDEEVMVSTAFTSYLSTSVEDPVLALDISDKCKDALKRYVPISEVDDTQRLLALRNFLVDALLKPFKKVGSKSPTISPAVADEFEDDIDASMATIETASRQEKFDLSKPIETRKRAVTWWALYRYFPIIGPNNIQPSTINQPANAMMLAAAFHQEYNAFRIAFEPGEKHSSGKNQIPMPNPSFLRIHFILAKIFNADPPLRCTLRIKE
ncbi:hypothetical protein QBC40DRAFT_293661 [Triangularia verruculosa]|uniref:HNH nuclease domain-containing protein n=1 Tax=Triangularia verruculosa TaxID=2587418 RepID=A0AAN6XMI3_9PEZI|nr:hypothetical protein QBC40DRAFT_293661 [Triangularia verruculosa]